MKRAEQNSALQRTRTQASHLLHRTINERLLGLLLSFAKISNVHRPITLALDCYDFGAIYIVLHYITTVCALLMLYLRSHSNGEYNNYSALSVRYGTNTALALGRFAPSGLMLCLNHISH